MDWFDLTGESVVRIAVAAVLGAAVGLEREIDDQPAGFRTHLSVCIGAALFGVISTSGFTEFEDTRSTTNVQIDVTRVASQVVVGIGFLGAGLIIRRQGKVENLTTAASLWVTAAVGLAAGVGNAGIALVTAIVLLVALALLRAPRDVIRRRFTTREEIFRVRLSPHADVGEAIDALDGLPGVNAQLVGAEKIDGRIEFRIQVRAEPGHSPARAVRPFLDRPDVEAMVSVDKTDGDATPA